MSYNVPDDWDMYFQRCGNCGSRYHESEGGCNCWEVNQDQLYKELINNLTRAVKIELEPDQDRWDCEDQLMDPIKGGEPYIRLFVVLYISPTSGRKTYDEYALTLENWRWIAKDLQARSTGCELMVAKRIS